MNSVINNRVVGSSFLWKALERSLSQIISLLVQIILARLIEPEHFGELAIIIAIVNYASIFVQSGLGTAIIQKKDLQKEDISTLLIISIGIAAFMYVILFVGAPYIASIYRISSLKIAIRVFSLSLFFNAINSVQVGLLSRNMDFKVIFLRSVCALPVSAIVGIILAYLNFGIWALIAYNLSNIIITCFVMFLKMPISLSFRFSLDSAKEMYGFSIKILFTGLVTGMHDMLRTMFVGRVYSTEYLAYHDKGMSYSNYVPQIITSTTSSVMLPVLARSQDNVNSLKSILRNSVKLIAFCTFPMLLGFGAISRQFVLIFLTDAWVGAIPFLVVYSFLRIPGCISIMDRQVYLALGKSGISLRYEIIFCFINLVVLFFNIFLFPYEKGPIMITIGATIVEYIGFFCICIITKKNIGYSFCERLLDIYKPFINSIIMFFIIYYIGLSDLNAYVLLFLQIISGIIIYLCLELLTKDEGLKKFYICIKSCLKRV